MENRYPGLYIHVPFCGAKCPYCDFYSLTGEEGQMDAYVREICRRLKGLTGRFGTLYFGGGTPCLLGGARLGAMTEAAAPLLAEGAEITVEVNPGEWEGDFFQILYASGVNRVSIGMQSAREEELRLLGRRHDFSQVERTALAARAAGIDNLSVDLMLAIPGQTRQSLRRTIEQIERLRVRHVSAYLLKIEEGTPFAARRLCLPDEEETCALYNLACRELEKLGFAQYEISNFAFPGFESRHNLKYWNGEAYLGLGPSAHSFYEGRRFHYPRSLTDFLADLPPVDDGPGGDYEEYAMLRLRLTEGLLGDIPPAYRKRAERLEKAGLTRVTPSGISLTREGFLLSNAVIGEILYGPA